MWPTGEGNGNPLLYFLENPIDSMKRQRNMTLQDEYPRLEGIQYATVKEQRAITNSSSKNEVAGPQCNPHSVVDVSGGER